MAFTPSLTTARPARRPARSFSGSSNIREVTGRSADFRSGAFLLESQHPPGRRPVVAELCPGKPALRAQCLKMRPARAQLDTPTTDGRANLPVCPNLTASQRSDAGGTLGIRTPEHRSARCGGSLGGAAAPPYLGVVSGCARPNQNKQVSSSLSKARKSACRGSLITNLKPPHDVFVPINSEELESKSVSDVVRPCPACSRSIGAAPPGMMAAQQRLSQNSVLLPPRPVRNERGED